MMNSPSNIWLSKISVCPYYGPSKYVGVFSSRVPSCSNMLIAQHTSHTDRGNKNCLPEKESEHFFSSWNLFYYDSRAAGFVKNET